MHLQLEQHALEIKKMAKKKKISLSVYLVFKFDKMCSSLLQSGV